ncbi:AcrR family transcriptional regulator [Sphingomonas jejuensis]|uniref:AcrR family transcriptional regulator n=1 Tax=Sphingomonas jejuensis TaxID=904715 RepID=A0ABX0XHP7_9SPHN|nr:TetR/AcrR family transcriptional regulator [Sphingomonas jejuensis]NJC32862.1 AcrR family transcriptional regulator [Sphingomonas jejuensis]
MHLFWRHGYETTSISDLTAAMGITPPSLYTAFGDKRRLFLEAVRRYAGEPEAAEAAIADAPSAHDAAQTLLTGAVEMFTGADTPPGCLLASATASGSAASQDVQAVVAAYRRRITDALTARIERDVAAGVLPRGADAGALAGLVVAVIQGLSVLARDGAPRTALAGVADAALRAWPEDVTA